MIHTDAVSDTASNALDTVISRGIFTWLYWWTINTFKIRCCLMLKILWVVSKCKLKKIEDFLFLMLCYAMLCYAMLCYAMLCYVRPEVRLKGNNHKQVSLLDSLIDWLCVLQIMLRRYIDRVSYFLLFLANSMQTWTLLSSQENIGGILSG